MKSRVLYKHMNWLERFYWNLVQTLAIELEFYVRNYMPMDCTKEEEREWASCEDDPKRVYD